MVLFIFKKQRWLTASALAVLLASASHAQPGPSTPAPASQALSPASASAIPVSAATKSGAGTSAFDSYKPYTEVTPGNWKAENDNVARIGGWREYAKQAQQPENTPAPTNKAVENMPTPPVVPMTKAKP